MFQRLFVLDAGLLGVLQGPVFALDFLLYVPQRVQLLFEGGDALGAGLVEIIVIGEGARDRRRVLLVQQQFKKFLLPECVLGADLLCQIGLLVMHALRELLFLIV